MQMRVKGINRVTAKGRLYFYHRKTGKRIHAPVGTAKFLEEIEFLNGLAAKKDSEKPGTLGDLILKYRDSPEYQAKAPATKTGYESVFDWLSPIRSVPLVDITPSAVIGLRDKAFKEHKRRFANYVVQVIRLVFNWGGGARDITKMNPAANVQLLRRPKTIAIANRAWSQVEKKAFLAASKDGLKAAIALGIYAGMREADVIKFPWSGYDGVTVKWIQQKTGDLVQTPAHKELRAILDRMPRVSPIVVTTARIRKPGTPPTPYTIDGFKTSFFKLRNLLLKDGKIGLGVTFHGLRHTMGKELDEGGADTKTIAVMLGHASNSMAEHYSKEGDKARKAKAGIAILERKRK